MGISVQPTTDGTISVQPQENTQPVSEETANSRATRAKAGGYVPEDYPDVVKALMIGQEKNLRELSANRVRLQKEQETQKLLINAANAKGGPLTPEDVALVRTTQGVKPEDWQPPMGPLLSEKTWPTDPRSVFEETYADQYMKYTDDFAGKIGEDHWWNEATNGIPRTVQLAKNEGSTLIATRELANSLLENVQDQYKKQGWFDWGVEQVARLVPGYRQAFLGFDPYDQADKILDLPWPQRKEKILQDVRNLRAEDPSLAIEYLEAIKGGSSSERGANLLSNLIDLTAIPGVGIAKGVYRGAKTVQLARQVSRMIDEVAKAPMEPAGKAAIANAVGDLPEAATQRIVKSVTTGGEPDATTEAMRSLPDYFNAMVQNIRNKPGRFGQELVNRTIESIEQYADKFQQLVETVQKVERVPGFLADEKAVRMWMEEIKKEYPGMENTILNISRPYYDKLGILHYDIDMGQHTGEYFTSKNVAEGFREKFAPNGTVVEPDGLGFFVRMTRPFDETRTSVREALLNTKGTQTPVTGHDMISSWIRTPEETMAAEQMIARKTEHPRHRPR